ncbi:MAG: hypothetical protein ACK4OJ_04190 [Brevundimonas sp.]
MSKRSGETDPRDQAFAKVDLMTAELEMTASIYDGFSTAIVVRGQPRTVGLFREFDDAVQVMAVIDQVRRSALARDKGAMGYGASRDQTTGNWILYSVSESAAIGLLALSDEACDRALSALRIQRLIEALRTDEGDCVTIAADDPEATDADDRMAVDCNGAWTDWNDRRFKGATVLQCLTKAVSAREEEVLANLKAQAADHG